MIKARSVLIGGNSVATRLFPVSFALASDLTVEQAFQSKEGIVFDKEGVPYSFSYQSLDQRDHEVETGVTAADLFASRREDATKRCDGLYVPALVPGCCNYYHLLIDCMSRVLVSVARAETPPRILISRFQEDRLRVFQDGLLAAMLDAFGLKDQVEIEEGALVSIERAIVTRGTSLQFAGEAIDLFQVAARALPSDRRRRTYICRGLASARRVVNEEDVIATVGEFGFQVAYLEQMTFEEQIALFRDSDVIIGPHGAGFANIVFSQPGTMLIELLQENALYKMPVFAELAGLAGCEHLVLQSKGQRNEHFPGHAGNMDMVVDCDDLRSVLAAYVQQRTLGLRSRFVQKRKAVAAPEERVRPIARREPPVLDVYLMGNMANRMIQYMVAQRVASAVRDCRISNASLPEWGIELPLLPDPSADGRGVPIAPSDLDISSMIETLSSGVETRVAFKTYAQWFPNFPDLDRCRTLFPADPEEVCPGFGPEFLVCNLRGGEILSGSFPHYVQLPVAFYGDLAASTGLKMVFMGQIEENSYCDSLRERFPDALFETSRGPKADFQTFRNSKNLVCAVSTFSWMSAWLSFADKIFLPINGMFNPIQCPAIDLLPYPDKRYRFFLFPKNYSVPLDQLEAAHKELEGSWEEISLEDIPELRASIYRRPVRTFDYFLAKFDEEYYLHTSKDVAQLVESGRLKNGRDHYITHGHGEGRSCFPFDVEWYRAQYPDAQEEVERGEYESFLHHYVLSGAARGYRARPMPILDVQLAGSFAERMIQYMVAQRICSETQESILSNASLPDWGINHARSPGVLGEPIPASRMDQRIDTARAARSLNFGMQPRLSLASGCQWIANFPDVEFCRHLFPAQEAEYPGFGREHLVCLIEETESRDPHSVLLPAEFYAGLRDSSGLELVFLGEREESAYWKALKQEFPAAKFLPSRGPKADFQIFRNSQVLVPGISVSAWLAAWLSQAERIELAVNGLFHPIQEPRVDLLPLDDDRYRFHLFPINYAVAGDALEQAHEALRGSWRPIGRDELSQLRFPRRTRQMENYLAFFDEEFYLRTYADVAAAVESNGLKRGLDHYVARGFREGRSGFDFDARWYSMAYPAAAREVGDGEYVDLPHQYVEAGAASGFLARPPRGRVSG